MRNMSNRSFVKLHNKKDTLKGNSGRKTSYAQMKEREKCKNRAITDLSGSRDVPFQSQEFGEDGHCHFLGFQAHFHFSMTSQTQCCKTIKK